MTRIEDEAVNAIRNTGADHLRVTVQGDEAPRRVAISSRRNKWQQLQAVLSTLEWTRIDCCDKAGGVIHTIVDEDATAPQAAPKSTPTLDAAAVLAERFASLLVQQHQAIVKAQAEQYGATIRGFENLCERQAVILDNVRAVFTDALSMQRSAFLSSAGGDAAAGGDNEMMKMLMMGWMQQRMAPPTASAPSPKTPPPPPPPKNGDPTKS